MGRLRYSRARLVNIKEHSSQKLGIQILKLIEYKKIVQDNRDKKKNTDSSAEFHQNQLESICVFYLLASFCPASFFISISRQII